VRFIPEGKDGSVLSWSIDILTVAGHVVMRCFASLTLKATGVVSSKCSPARLRRKRQDSVSDITQARKMFVTRILEGDGKTPAS